jgi:hypothetical protein
MLKLWNKLKGKKTYICSATMILYAIIIIGWQGGNWSAAGDMVLQALAAAGIRNAI